MKLCLLNGIPTPSIDSRHRMLAFGDGLFETCYAEGGGIRFWPNHLARLEQGLATLQMAWSRTDRKRLEAEVKLALSDQQAPVVCKILLGRQVAGRGYDFDPQVQTTDRVVQVFDHQMPDWVDTGADLVLADVPASMNSALAGVKHLNRLDSVLARQTARRQGAHEALLALPDGRLVEGSMSNVYVRLAGEWSTPRLDQAGVNGILRRRLLQQSSQPLVERDCWLTELARAEAMLISNSLIGLVPVRSLDHQSLSLPDREELQRFRYAIGLPSD